MPDPVDVRRHHKFGSGRYQKRNDGQLVERARKHRHEKGNEDRKSQKNRQPRPARKKRPIGRTGIIEESCQVRKSPEQADEDRPHLTLDEVRFHKLRIEGYTDPTRYYPNLKVSGKRPMPERTFRRDGKRDNLINLLRLRTSPLNILRNLYKNA